MKTKNVKMITTRYLKGGRKWIEQDKELDNITEEQYNNFIDSKGFFTSIGAYERHTKAYTREGYMVIEINTISPDRKQKIVRVFDF